MIEAKARGAGGRRMGTGGFGAGWGAEGSRPEVIAAEAPGLRTSTPTSSQGLALMHEPLFIAPPMHLPIVMSIVNRTVAAPLGIWVEDNDTMPQRDTGWMQAYVEDA